MSFIGKVVKRINFTATVVGGSGYTTIYSNNNFLAANKNYVVTAEIAFKRVGTGWDGVLISFHNTETNYMGLPFTANLGDNVPYLYNVSGTLLGTPHSIRQSAQAYITNGKILLKCDSSFNDTIIYHIWISAIQVN